MFRRFLSCNTTLQACRTTSQKQNTDGEYMTARAESWFLPKQKTNPEYTFYQSSIRLRFQSLIFSTSAETKALFSQIPCWKYLQDNHACSQLNCLTNESVKVLTMTFNSSYGKRNSTKYKMRPKMYCKIRDFRKIWLSITGQMSGTIHTKQYKYVVLVYSSRCHILRKKCNKEFNRQCFQLETV